ncbi:hypothetical protein DSECCO2_563790 [anaerobic digester metagenome]
MESITSMTPSRSSSHFTASITPSVASLDLFFDSTSLIPCSMKSWKSIFVASPGVSTISRLIVCPLVSIVTPFFLFACLVSWAMCETDPIVSSLPTQSLRIRLLRVVLPAFGGPYIPIHAPFFLNSLLNIFEKLTLNRFIIFMASLPWEKHNTKGFLGLLSCMGYWCFRDIFI